MARLPEDQPLCSSLRVYRVHFRFAENLLPDSQKTLDFQRFQTMYGGGNGIRTHAGLPPNGFQDRRVMTTSLSLPGMSAYSNW